MSFVTIQTYTYPNEMSIVRGLLESEGIETFVRDEIISQVNPFYANAVGGIKLQVHEEDYLRAREILVEKGFIKEGKKQETDHLEDKLTRLLTSRTHHTYRVAILLLVLLIFFIYYIFQNS